MRIVTDSQGKEYVAVPTRNGDMCFKKGTPQGVISAIVGAYHSKERIRVFYGDKVTGADWGEEHDTQGTIGRTRGEIPIPILINNARSFGGSALLDDCIVKITYNKRVIYQHPTYQNFAYEYKNQGAISRIPWHVYRKHPITGQVENCANFETELRAKKYIDFMLGNLNRK